MSVNPEAVTTEDKVENSNENAASEALAGTGSLLPPAPPAAVRPTSLPKPSGLKPPSKIGRLCSNAAPKPAVPASPRSDGGSSDTVRRLSDDLARKHLSDLIEAEEDEVSSSRPDPPRAYRKASSSSSHSMMSMDALWERFPRRLSEAGLRRSSDHSVVLTEDTDSFIIGERVWVGGAKPGQIAYIGETQFAPGDWAGIVLDEPIGKNDGSVGGVRYFQCGERRGVFSRLTRLTRHPLVAPAHDRSPASDAGGALERPPSAARRRALSPSGSMRSAYSSKMNASIATSSNNGEVRVGDRVIVSSSRGSKAGVLRYAGAADFAPGAWAGVELDDPLGKNDGSVDGKRYFECAPRFGLFAPLSKVSRSPSSRRPGSCAVHCGAAAGGGRGTPLARRSGSRESLVSLSTSVASSRAVRPGAQRASGPRAASTPVSAKNALQEMLREKQHHLEQLMRERELERADVARHTLHAQRADTAAQQANAERARLAAELATLRQRLEDERQRVEDLLFRAEEDNIHKDDFTKYKEAMEQEKAALQQRVLEAEAAVSLQAARAEEAAAAAAAALLALDAQRAADAAAAHDQHREELSAAQKLQKLLDEAYALLKEKEFEKDSLGKSLSEELNRVRAESEKAISEAKTRLAISQTEYEAQTSVLTAKLQLAETKLEAEKQSLEKHSKENSQTIVELNAKIAQLQAVVDDKSQELNKVVGTSKEHELNLNKEITKLKMELSAKVLDLEQLTDSNKKHETLCRNLQEEINKVKEDSAVKINEIESLLSEASQNSEVVKTEMENLRQSLTAKTRDYEKLLNDIKSTESTSEVLINEYKQTIHERDKEIIKLKGEFEQVTADFNIKHSKIAEEHKKEIEDRNNKIEQLQKDIDGNAQALTQSKTDYETLNSQLAVNFDELKLLKEENDNLKKTVADLTQTNNSLKERISTMELDISEQKRLLENASEKCSELQKSKEKIESEYMNLTGQATDSNEQFNQLSLHLKETEKELQDMKDKNREIINSHGRTEEELRQQICKLQEEFSSERTELVKAGNETLEKLQATQNVVKEFEAQMNELKNRIKDYEVSNDKFVDENRNLKKDIEDMKAKETELTTEYKSIRKQMEDDIDRYKQEISMLRAEGATSEVKLMEKVDQLIEAQNDLNYKLEEARKHEDTLQKVIDDMTAKLNGQKSQYEQEIAQIQIILSNEKRDCNNLKVEETRLKELLQEKETNQKELTLKLEMLQVDVTSNGEVITEKDRQLAQVQQELNNAVELKKQFEEKFNTATIEITTVKQLYENLIANSSAEETLLKEQQDKLEVARKDLAVATQEKSSLETQLTDATEELRVLKLGLEEVDTQLKENVALNAQLKKYLDEKEALLQAQGDKCKTDSDNIQVLTNELAQIKKDLSSKNVLIEKKESEVKKLQEVLDSGANETQQALKHLQTEKEELLQKYTKETETLNATCKSLQSKISEQEKSLHELDQNQARIKELQEQLDKAESDIKQLSDINEGQKTNYTELNKQLQAHFDEYKRDAKRTKHDLKARLSDYEKHLQESIEKLSTETDSKKEIQLKLAEAETSVIELRNKLELLSVQQSDSSQKDGRMEAMTLELQALRQAQAELASRSQSEINTLSKQLENHAKSEKEREELIAKLQEQIKTYKAKVEIAEREKVLLQREYETQTRDLGVKDKNDNRAAPGDADSVKLLEEKDGQVTFLNSVIVDMQRKNETLLARVAALESAAPAAPAPRLNGRARAPAPRLFCDICDVFDRHDTEDCPRQAAPADPRGPPDQPRRPPPPPRDYCDICEVFGHSTENCDEEETF